MNKTLFKYMYFIIVLTSIKNYCSQLNDGGKNQKPQKRCYVIPGNIGNSPDRKIQLLESVIFNIDSNENNTKSTTQGVYLRTKKNSRDYIATSYESVKNAWGK